MTKFFELKFSNNINYSFVDKYLSWLRLGFTTGNLQFQIVVCLEKCWIKIYGNDDAVDRLSGLLEETDDAQKKEPLKLVQKGRIVEINEIVEVEYL